MTKATLPPTLAQTPSQTIGPFFSYALTPHAYGRPTLVGNVLADTASQGQLIHIAGRVTDGAGAPVADALVEIWQANAAGRYQHPEDARDQIPLDDAFTGCGRVGTEADGRYQFTSIKPGAIGDGQAPHINVVVSARGMLLHVFTRIYFADEGAANAYDRVLASVPAARRHTLIAATGDNHQPDVDAGRSASAVPIYTFDIRLQGAGETVFFDA